MLIEEKYNVVLRSFDGGASLDYLHKNICNELNLSEMQCRFILQNLPILLYQDLGEEDVELIKPRLDSLMQVGVNYEITTSKVNDLTPMLWKSEEIVEAVAKTQIADKDVTESDTMNNTTDDVVINCPCASCGSVLQITRDSTGVEIKSISSATKNPLQQKLVKMPRRKYTYEELENIIRAVEENVYGGIESLQDLPTKPEFSIDFTEYGFKSVTDFMEYQNSLMSSKSLDSWTGGN